MKQDIKDLIKRELGVDGDRIVGRGNPGRMPSPAYFVKLNEWGLKVRRDILVIEHHLKSLGVDPADMYGDPGDPPPPPE